MRTKRRTPVLPLVDVDVFVDESGQLNDVAGEVNAMAAVYMLATQDNLALVTDLVGDLRERIHGERSAAQPVKAHEWNQVEVGKLVDYVKSGRWSVMYAPLTNSALTSQAVVEIPKFVREQAQKMFAATPQTRELRSIEQQWEQDFTKLVNQHPRYAVFVITVMWGVIKDCIDRGIIPNPTWVFDERVNKNLSTLFSLLSIDTLRIAVKSRFNCSIREAIGGEAWPNRPVVFGRDNEIDGLVLADGIAYATGMRERNRLTHEAWNKAYERLFSAKVSPIVPLARLPKPPLQVIELDAFVDGSGWMSEETGEVSSMAALIIPASQRQHRIVHAFVKELREHVRHTTGAEQPVKGKQWTELHINKLERLANANNWHVSFSRLTSDSEVLKELDDLDTLARRTSEPVYQDIIPPPSITKDSVFSRHRQLVETHRVYAGCLFHLFFTVYSKYLDNWTLPAIRWTLDNDVAERLAPATHKMALEALMFNVWQRHRCSIEDAIARAYPDRGTTIATDDTIDGLVLADALAFSATMHKKALPQYTGWQNFVQRNMTSAKS